jgi:hypothetical protein
VLQVVERAFGLWKWKWGIFWRPLDIAEKNIKCVVEATARLHNFCIDCKTSTNLDDFIVHDDLFWTRTSSQSKRVTYQLPDLQEHQLIPDYSDAPTIAAHTGIRVDAPADRTTRQRLCQHILDHGFTAPDISSITKNIQRVCGINRKQQVPFATRAIGTIGQ